MVWSYLTNYRGRLWVLSSNLSTPLTLEIVFIWPSLVLSIPGLWQRIIDCKVFFWNIYIRGVTLTAVFLNLFITMVIFFVKFDLHYPKIFTKWKFTNTLDGLIYHQQNLPLLSKNLRCFWSDRWWRCVCICVKVCLACCRQKRKII